MPSAQPPAPRSSPTQGWSLGALVEAVRPRQWVKNVLVLAAPALGDRLGQSQTLVHSAVAFVVFCLAASGIYLVNDVRDVAEDRAHERKRLRPVAAGRLVPRLALTVAVVLLVAAPLLSLLATLHLAEVMVAYEVLFIAYCVWLKDEPVIDLAIVSSGFLLRAVAGGAASEIRLSQWFLLAASFGSLFMAAGKRYAEVLTAEPGAPATRRLLHRYTETYLRFVWSVSAAVLIMTYALWSFQISADHKSVWAEISMAPFVLAVLRYAVMVDAGEGGEPEDVALHDHVLQVIALVWVGCLLVAVYA